MSVRVRASGCQGVGVRKYNVQCTYTVSEE